ncbi:MAG TPA: hypothetical protein VMW65_07830 [Chloroflexota bacterium]|nr:hypothetical protein [Chloroflexota bacterium]
MEVWVQESLFPEPSGGHHEPDTSKLAVPSRRHLVRGNWSRVTRDPAVASSHATGAALASDFRTGLANAFAQLTPEQRAEIRAAVGSRRSESAA